MYICSHCSPRFLFHLYLQIQTQMITTNSTRITRITTPIITIIIISSSAVRQIVTKKSNDDTQVTNSYIWERKSQQLHPFHCRHDLPMSYHCQWEGLLSRSTLYMLKPLFNATGLLSDSQLSLSVNRLTASLTSVIL